MYEGEKLSEAELFLTRLAEAEAARDRTALKSYLSAFLSASRSVLQYARAEAKMKGELSWYDGAVTVDPCIAFLRDERNTNIHERPAAPVEVTSVELSGHLDLVGRLDVAVRDADGHVKDARTLSGTTLKAGPEADVTATTQFFFLNWTGAESVVALCHRYLRALEAIVREGTVRGVLTDSRSYR